MIGYALTATLGALGVARERDHAEREAAAALRQTMKAEQVTAFLLGLFEGSDPAVARGDTITARELLARGVERADAFADQPEVQAMLLGVTGRIHFNLGRLDQAEALLRRALRVWARVPDADPLAIAEVRLALAAAYELQARYDESSAIYRELAETTSQGDAGAPGDAGRIGAIRSERCTACSRRCTGSGGSRRPTPRSASGRRPWRTLRCGRTRALRGSWSSSGRCCTTAATSGTHPLSRSD
ncbi:MAG TPA: tetratricopeptide repeat protein [Longimicrobiales bacterium]